jgi:preprotein translocase subunit Sec61beta
MAAPTRSSTIVVAALLVALLLLAAETEAFAPLLKGA